MPLKTDILQHLDVVSPASKATGACNTIVLEKQADGTEKLVGTNTDVLGEFLVSLRCRVAGLLTSTSFSGVKNSLLRTLRHQHPDHSFSLDQKFPSGTATGLVI